MRDDRVAVEIDTLQLIIALGYTIGKADAHQEIDENEPSPDIPTPRRQKDRATALPGSPRERGVVMVATCAAQVCAVSNARAHTYTPRSVYATCEFLWCVIVSTERRRSNALPNKRRN